jgi:ribonucleoside-triphosphate reductase
MDNMNNCNLPTDRERGKGVKFSRIRRITGYLTGDLNTWNGAKREELKDRVKHL